MDEKKLLTEFNKLNVEHVQLRPTTARKEGGGPLMPKGTNAGNNLANNMKGLSMFGKRTFKEVGLTPDQYTIATSTIPNAGNGAFANIYLPKKTVLGIYKGKLLTPPQYEALKDDSYVWEISTRHGPMYIDGKNPKVSNWLRYLNDIRNNRLYNVEMYQSRGNVYYRTIKPIKPGQEMFISYGDYYW